MKEFIIRHWRDGIEICILWLALYQIYRSMHATQGARVLLGLVGLAVVALLITFLLKLQVISWILTHIGVALIFASLVLFQPELRAALARFGSSRVFSILNFGKSEKIEFVGTFCDTVILLSKKRIGALFAFEREIILTDQIETGVPLNAEFSSELAMTVFYPGTALHDGGMVLSKNRIAAAACIFPVSQKELSDRALGLRHRASIGLTENTDAVAVVVSEETGGISIAIDGQLERGLNPEDFRKRMEEIFLVKKEAAETEKDDDEKLVTKDRLPDSSDRNLVSH